MKNFTFNRYEAFEKKLRKTQKLISEMQSSIDECSRGDYKAKDTERIRNLRASSMCLGNMYGQSITALQNAVLAAPLGKVTH